MSAVNEVIAETSEVKKQMTIQKIKEYKETEQLTVKMATIGRVPEFEATKEDFDSYLERFERWLINPSMIRFI